MNRRQMEILLELCDNPDTYRPASWFARKQDVSLRTVRNDMNTIRLELEQYPCVELQSSASRGSRIVIRDAERSAELRQRLFSQISEQARDDQEGRLQKLLVLLLRQHRSITYYDLENAVFVSHNTLLSDLKRVEEAMGKYGLRLLRDSNRVVIDGRESEKRRCILGENLVNPQMDLPDIRSDGDRDFIRCVLNDVFAQFRHSVSEAELSDMADWLYVSLRRMEENFFLAPEHLEIEEELFSERKIAETVFDRLRRKYPVQPPDTELDYFALYIRGRRNFTPSTPIPEEIREVVTEFLEFFRRESAIDLTHDAVFQEGLALHCIPMVIRMKYDMQLRSRMADDVRRSFPFGYDMATYFGSFLRKKYGKELRDAELALLAVHMHQALSDAQVCKGKKRVLILSALRRSEELYLRKTLEHWFPDSIGEMTFLPPTKMEEALLDRYDVFLTTEQGRYYEIGLAVYLHPVPDQRDYWNIRAALEGFQNLDDILRVFHPELFYVFPSDVDRDAALRTLCEKASQFLDIPPFHDLVLDREALGSTFFGGEIAAPHPVSALPYDTFIAVGVLPRPIPWDNSGSRVRMVFLTSGNKNNSPSFHMIWNYLSRVFSHRDFVNRLLKEPTWERFIALLKEAFTDSFGDVL